MSAAGSGMVALLAGLFAGVPPVAADAEWQFIPELDVHVRLDDANRFDFLFRRTQDVEFEATEGTTGAHLSHRVAPHLRTRAGYRYVHSIGEDPPSREHRALFEITPSANGPWATVLDARNRLELRWVDGDASWRARPRVRVEREWRTGTPRSLTPYACAEPFFDSRVDRWARWRYDAGVETRISERVMVDVFYRHQDDTLPSERHLRAFGGTLNLTF